MHCSTDDSSPRNPRRRSLGRFAVFVSALAAYAVVGAPPYLTGVVDDADSQVIEMPRLPGMWQRQVAWLGARRQHGRARRPRGKARPPAT